MLFYIIFLYIFITVYSLHVGKIRSEISPETNVRGIPSEAEAAEVARTLVHRESLMNVNTCQMQGGSECLFPMSAMEYYVDCDADGDPYWLIVDVGTTYQNLMKGSEYSFTIRMGDHPLNDYVNPNYPGGISTSPSGSPRILMRGIMLENLNLSPLKIAQLERCFLDRHPDSKWWLPSNLVSPHKSHWAKIYVNSVYMVGGFGDRAYIGDIDPEIYHASSPHE